MSSKKIADQKKDLSEKVTKTADGFVDFISRTGINPARPQNSLTVGHYNFNLLTRNRIQLEAAYRGSWMTGQIIDAYADDMTRAGINLSTNEAAERIEELQVGMSRLQIWNSLNSLVKWSRLYGGAIGVIQIKGQKLDTPLDPESISQGQFLGITVYDRWQLNPDLTNLISEGPELGLPAYYSIVLGSTSGAQGSITSTRLQQSFSQGQAGSPAGAGEIVVHHSRCIRMVGIELPYFQAITEMMWGESVIERVWDRMIAFDQTSLSTANLVDRAQLRMVGIDKLREIIALGGDAFDGLVQMFEMVREFQTNEGLTLLDKNDVYSTSSYSFAGLSDVLLQFGQQLAGASGIPLVRLFGQSPAGLSATGESDLRMYYDNINAQQEARMRNPMELILSILYRSLFGQKPPADLQFTFTPLWQMSAIDQATITKTNTDSVIAAHSAALISTATAMNELRQSSGDGGLFANISDEEIREAEQDEPPLPEPLPEDPISSPASLEIPKTSQAGDQKFLEKVKGWLAKTRF